MLGINLSQLTRLRDILSRTHGFDDLMTFRSLFVDSRIARWRNRIPVASTPAACIDVLIATLCDLDNNYGENALLLFLHVLFDNTPSGDTLHDDLGQLIKELETINPSLVLTVPMSPDSSKSSTTPTIASSGDPARSLTTLPTPLNRAEEPPIILSSSDSTKSHVPPPSPLLKKKCLFIVLVILLVIVTSALVYVYICSLLGTGANLPDIFEIRFAVT